MVAHFSAHDFFCDKMMMTLNNNKKQLPTVFLLVIIIILVSKTTEGGPTCDVFYSLPDNSLEAAVAFGKANNFAFVDNLAVTNDYIRQRGNFVGGSPVSMVTLTPPNCIRSCVGTPACRGRWWFRCCPSDGSYYSTNCAGSQMSYPAFATATSDWLLPSGVTCTQCPPKPAANAIWTSNCAWICVSGYSRSSQSNICECASTWYIDAAALCLACPVIANGVVASLGINQKSCGYICNAGFIYSEGVCIACTPRPFRRLLYTIDCASACIEGYTWDLSQSACIPCGFNQYRAWSSTDTGCTQVTTLTPQQGMMCAPGEYYVLDKVGPDSGDQYSWISCAKCSPPSNGVYQLRDVSTSLTALVSIPDACYTRACPLSSVAGTYTMGCGGTSAGYAAACNSGLMPYSNGLYGYYGVQSDIAVPCPIVPCLQCPSASDTNPYCPVAGGNTPGSCAPCASVSNGIIVFDPNYPNLPCNVQCNAGYFKYDFILVAYKYAPGGCFQCQTSATCSLPGYYKDASNCPSTSWGGGPIKILDPVTGLVLSTTYVGPNDGDGPCLSCNLGTGMVALQSLAQLGPSACRWECNVGYYLRNYYGIYLTYCAVCDPSAIVCGIGQYVLAACLTTRGTITGPQCDACQIPRYAVASGGPSPLVNNRTACPFTCNAGYWKNSAFSCTILTASSACPKTGGLYWGGGTALRDNGCLSCPSNRRPSPNNDGAEDTTLWLAPGVDCSWNCTAGAFLDTTLFLTKNEVRCTQCPAGKYKMEESNATTCTLCNAGTYLPSGPSMQKCLQAPSFSTVVSDRSDFVCNGGYIRTFSAPNIICSPCFNSATASSFSQAIVMQGMNSLEFMDDQCIVKSFTCVGGFYRSIATSNAQFNGAKARCIQCPNFEEGSGSIRPSDTTLRDLSTIYVSAFFNLTPSSSACAGDERGLACNVGGCYPGFFMDSTPPCGAASVQYLTMRTCAPCSNPASACAVGTTLSQCPGVRIRDDVSSIMFSSIKSSPASSTCVPCSTTLTVGMMWMNSVQCEWGCITGYAASGNACIKCLSGTFSVAGACIACAGGTYADQSGASACLNCSAGTFSNTPAGASTCTACDVGNYAKSAASTTCIACDPGSISSAATACSVCPVETPYVFQNTCVLPMLSVDPSAICPDGFYLTYSKARICTGCPEGNYCVRSILYPCPWGTPPAPRLSYTATQCAETIAPDTCVRVSASLLLPCPTNTINPNLRGRSALWCHPIAGYYGMRGARAIQCPVDAFCPSVVTAPIPCATGTYAVAGSISCSATMLSPCRNGWYLPFNEPVVCAPCPSGCYCFGNKIFPCLAETAAWWSPPLSSSIAECRAPATMSTVTCPANTQPPQVASVQRCRSIGGYYYIPGWAAGVLCPLNYYCPTGALQPILCPAPTICSTVGAMQVTVVCPQGSSNAATSCLPCPSVPSNAFYTTAGSCAACCNAGFYYAGGSCIAQPSTADACNPGFYAPAYPICTVGTLPCVACPPPTTNAGTYLLVSMAEIWLVDLPRAYGAENTCLYFCQPGFYASANSSIFKSSDGGDNYLKMPSAMCLPCPPGTIGPYIPAVIQTCTNCSPDRNMYTSVSGSTWCNTCSTYGISDGRSCSCIGGAILVSSLTMTCSACPTGAMKTSETSCSMCPTGKYINDKLQTCPIGYYTAKPNASMCEPCPVGSISVSNGCAQCPPGTFFISGCVPCPPGTYNPFGGAMECLDCAVAGALSGAGVCGCPETKYFDLMRGAMVCGNCPLSTAAGASACGCPPTYYYEPSTLSCQLCALRCAPGGGSIKALKAGACGTTSTGTKKEDFTCTCPIGYRGNGFDTPCVRCQPQENCNCTIGYYFGSTNACLPCRVCPPLSRQIVAGCSLSGLTTDDTKCVCPPLHYHSLTLNLCVPCSRCAVNATTVTSCSSGSDTLDVTTCVCKNLGTTDTNNGFICR